MKWKGIVEYSSVDNTTYNNAGIINPNNMLEISAIRK